MSDELKWWGYRHVIGDLVLKRFWHRDYLREAESSPFVDEVFGPFSAASREEAMEILKKELRP